MTDTGCIRRCSNNMPAPNLNGEPAHQEAEGANPESRHGNEGAPGLPASRGIIGLAGKPFSCPALQFGKKGISFKLGPIPGPDPLEMHGVSAGRIPGSPDFPAAFRPNLQEGIGPGATRAKGVGKSIINKIQGQGPGMD